MRVRVGSRSSIARDSTCSMTSAVSADDRAADLAVRSAPHRQPAAAACRDQRVRDFRSLDGLVAPLGFTVPEEPAPPMSWKLKLLLMLPGLSPGANPRAESALYGRGCPVCSVGRRGRDHDARLIRMALLARDNGPASAADSPRRPKSIGGQCEQPFPLASIAAQWRAQCASA